MGILIKRYTGKDGSWSSNQKEDNFDPPKDIAPIGENIIHINAAFFPPPVLTKSDFWIFLTVL